MTTQNILENALNAKSDAFSLNAEQKKRAVISMADALLEDMDYILEQNKIDLKNADGKISEVMKDRLSLTEKRIGDMAESMKKVALLPDPVGKVIEKTVRRDGLNIKKVSVPIGVIGVIYESRPNVTSDVAAICIKSGNVCILRGGKEAFNSASAIVNSLKKGLKKEGINENIVNLITDTSRESANELMRANGYVDLLIPRGGKGLIDACVKNATVPCIQTGTGICHIYVDEFANLDMALNIIENAKTSRPSVCNAAEVLLVNSKISEKFLPLLKKRLVDERAENKVELRLCERSEKIIGGKKAESNDFDTEFLDFILAVKVVDSTKEAIEHISKHSTGHSEAIISENKQNQNEFAALIDSAAVYINASTRFTDGGEFGLGCEIGISTQKIHARGPMGINELTTYKYIIEGNGQIR